MPALSVRRLGRVGYDDGIELQRTLVEDRRAGRIGDTLLLLEHPHVFTLGRGGDARYLLEARPGAPVFRVSRGGQVTYHGPGQLVGYPILKFEGHDRDLRADCERQSSNGVCQFGAQCFRKQGDLWKS